jgi:hypothetical protein
MTPQPVGGFKPATIRGLHVAISTLSIPSCVPIAICGLLAGTLCVAAAWWNALPATLPGDELFNAERAIGLTFRALIDWSQPADAPPMPRLALWGIGIDLSALAVLFAGAALRLFRPSIDAQLARHASDVRMVVLGDEAATVVAAEPTQYTNIFLSSGMPGSSTLRGLRARLDPDFLAASLPRIAPRVRELLALGIDSSANIELVRRTLNLRRESLPARSSSAFGFAWIHANSEPLSGAKSFQDLQTRHKKPASSHCLRRVVGVSCRINRRIRCASRTRNAERQS